MKRTLTLFTVLSVLFFGQNSFAAATKAAPAMAEAPAQLSHTEAEATWANMSKKEKREYRKSIKKDLKKAIKNWKSAGSKDTETLLLVIIAILLPPVAMALYDGFSKRFWISLLLTIIFYIPGLIYTLIVILGGK